MSAELPKEKLVIAKNWVHTGVIRLKDGDHQRGAYIDLFRVFGFVPRFIAVTKVNGQNNRFIVSAEKTPEILEWEEKRIAKETKNERPAA